MEKHPNYRMITHRRDGDLMNPKSGFAIFKTRFFYVLLGVLVGMLLPSAFALADNPINLVVNGQAVQCDVPPVIINGRTMVPIRTVAEALGCQVSWDARLKFSNYKLKEHNTHFNSIS